MRLFRLFYPRFFKVIGKSEKVRKSFWRVAKNSDIFRMQSDICPDGASDIFPCGKVVAVIANGERAEGEVWQSI